MWDIFGLFEAYHIFERVYDTNKILEYVNLQLRMLAVAFTCMLMSAWEDASTVSWSIRFLEVP